MYLEVIGIGGILIIFFIVIRVQASRRKDNVQLKTGLALVAIIKRVIILSQQHRGISNAFSLGDALQKPKLISLQHELDQLLRSESSRQLNKFSQWESFVEHWPRLKNHVLTGKTNSQNIIRQHNLMIEGHLSLFDDVCRYYNVHTIMLDRFIHASELFLDTLRTAETIGQARAVGAGICAKGASEGVDFISLNFLKISLASSTKELSNAFGTLDNPELSDVLTNYARDIVSNTAKLISVIENQVLIDSTITLDSKEYFDLATSPIDDLFRAFTAIETHTLNYYTK